MSLETGYYFLYAFDADQRPLGAQQIPHIPNEQVVVDEHATVPHKVSDDVLMFPNAY
jgi:hypothetical protein